MAIYTQTARRNIEAKASLSHSKLHLLFFAVANLQFQSTIVSIPESSPEAVVVVQIAPGGGILTASVSLTVSTTVGGSATGKVSADCY